jgi:tetratricopeptide (TPR) repeat protein
MAKWTAFPYDAYAYDAAALKRNWARLHAGDAEPLPKDDKVLAAWALFHAGDFQKAYDAGLKAGENGLSGGITVANKAQAIYANYLEKSEKTKLEMFLEVAERAQAQQAGEPKNANAWYWQAYALGRYSQGISVAKALAQGLGGKVKSVLETTIKLAPKHADAHIALGAFHAEVIDKVGRLLGKTQGADAATGLKLYQQALKLNPTSAIAMIEYANGLVMLEGDKKMKQAEELYAQAAACEPLDAMERLDVEMARAELDD